MARPNMKTTKKQIVDWGMRNIDECGYGVDASEMNKLCWRCGHKRKTQKCHVIPYSLGGKDIPSNYRLFCHDCHLEQPNVNDYNATDKWVRDTRSCTYDTYYSKSFSYEVQKLLLNYVDVDKLTVEETNELLDKINIAMRKFMKNNVSSHWGKGLNEATRCWVLEKSLEEVFSNEPV